MSEIKKNNVKQRNSSIELLRIMAIIGVIILHYNEKNTGKALSLVDSGSLNMFYLFFIESVFICAVNLFIIISAFFLSSTQKRKSSKIFELILQLIIFRVIFYILPVVLSKETFDLSSFLWAIIPSNYFVILYSVLYIVSPYINILLNHLPAKVQKKLLIALIIIFSVWSFGVDMLQNITDKEIIGLSPISIYGSDSGFTIVNFVLVYFVGAYIRINNVSIPKLKCTVLLAATILGIFVYSAVETALSLKSHTAWYYNNPLVIIVAALALILFSQLHFESKVINELAKASFTCFLVHGVFFKYIKIPEFVNKNIFILILHQIGSAILIFLLSYVVFFVYKIGTSFIIKRISSTIDKIPITVEE